MACRVTSVNNQELDSLIKELGADEGIKVFIQKNLGTYQESKSMNILRTPDQQKSKILLDHAANNKGFMKPITGTSLIQAVNSYNAKFIENPLSLRRVSKEGDYYIVVTVKNPTIKPDESKSIKSKSSNKTDDNVIKALRDRITNLKRQASKLKDSPLNIAKRNSIKDQIDLMEKQLQFLSEENNMSNYYSVAEQQLGWVESRMKQDKFTMSEIESFNNIISIWRNIKDFSGISELDSYDAPEDIKNIVKDMSIIEGMANTLQNGVNKLTEKKLIEQSKGSLKEQDFKERKETSFLNRLLDVSYIEDNVVKFINKLVASKDRLFLRKSHDMKTELKTRFDKIKNNPIFQKYGWNLFWQDNGDGMVLKIDQKYWDELKMNSDQYKSAIASAKNESEKKTAFENYRRFQKENSIMVDSNQLFNGSDETYNKERERLIKLTGDAELVDYQIERAKDKIEKFNKDFDQFKFELDYKISMGDILVPEDTTIEEFKEKSHLEWRNENSPFGYINNQLGVKDPAKGYKGYKYVVFFPVKNKTINGKKVDSGYYNEKYKIIESDKDLLEYHKFVYNFLKHYKRVLPDYMIYDLKTNWLPELRQQALNDTSIKSIQKSLEGIPGQFVDSLTVSKDGSTFFREIDPITGKPKKEIPVKYVKTGLSMEEREKDLHVLMQMFGEMALNYELKSEIEDEVLAAHRIIQTAEEMIVDANGKPATNRAGDILKTKNGLAELKKQIEHYIDARLYGKTRQDPDKTSIEVYSTIDILSLGTVESSKKKAAKRLRNEIDEIENKIDDELDKEFPNEKVLKSLNEQKSEKTKEFNALGGGNLSKTKVGDFLIKLTQLNGVGLNPFSALNNVIFGVSSNFIVGNGRVDYNMSQAYRALRAVTGVSSRFRINKNDKNAKKIYNFILRSGVVENEDFKREDKNMIMKNIDKYAYSLLRNGDFMLKGQMLLAMSYNTKINGKEMFDYINEEGVLELPEGVEFDEDAFYNRAYQLIKQTHGNYDSTSPMMVKNNVWGRIFLTFRSWIPEGINSRFGSKQFDQNLGRNRKGRYVTLFDLGLSKSISTLFKQITYQKDAFEGFENQEDIENMRKNLAELSYTLLLLAMGAAVKYGLDDDDEDQQAIRKVLINTLARLQDETTFYISPGSFTSIIKNPVPILKTVQEASRSIGEIGYNFTLPATWDEDYDAEKSTMKILRGLPAANNIPRVVSMAKKEFD